MQKEERQEYQEMLSIEEYLIKRQKQKEQEKTGGTKKQSCSFSNRTVCINKKINLPYRFYVTICKTAYKHIKVPALKWWLQ